MFTLFLLSPLSVWADIFVSCLIIQCASKDIRAVSMFSALPSPNQTFTNSYLTYKHTDLSRLSQKFPPENNSRIKSNYCSFTRKALSCPAENSQQERNSSLVTKGSGMLTTQHLFLMDKQESGDNSSCAHVTWHCLSPLVPESDPELKHTTTSTHAHAQMLTPEQASIFNCIDDVRLRCRGSFPDSSDLMV